MRVTTFYSYKGGLGRSLLVARAARSLAAQGRSVVALDLDLEAPGLAFKLGFGRKDDLGAGIVGLLSRYQRGEPPPTTLKEWLRPVPDTERLWLLPAGPVVTATYWRELASLSWKDLFFGLDPQGVRFFQWLREAIEEKQRPEHLLIDARTGVTEMGGAALSLMADQILALVGTAEEGIHGTREVLRAVVGAPRAPGRPSPRIGLVLSRMPASMATPDLQQLRRVVRDQVIEEADPLTTTVHVELPLVIRSEPVLEVDERRAGERGLRIHEDYEAVLSWLQGGGVPEEPPGILVPRDPSVEALRRSIAFQTELAERDPTSYLPDLAASLENLTPALANQGRPDEAVLTAKRAIEIYRRLAADRPDVFETELAKGLNNLGVRLSGLGHRQEALLATQEAVELYRRLAKTRPDVFEPELAMALNNMSVDLSHLGRREQAVLATQEAVELYRRLAKTHPDIFEPELAPALNNLSVNLSNLGCREEALRAMQEGAELYRRLTKAHAGAFEPDLASALHNLSLDFFRLERRKEALLAMEEAVHIWRQLAKASPDLFEPNLAMGLGALGGMLGKSDARAVASIFEESLRVLLPHLKRTPGAFAGTASTLASDLIDACRQAGVEPDAELLAEIAGHLGEKAAER